MDGIESELYQIQMPEQKGKRIKVSGFI